jgi:hypothetical protein
MTCGFSLIHHCAIAAVRIMPAAMISVAVGTLITPPSAKRNGGLADSEPPAGSFVAPAGGLMPDGADGPKRSTREREPTGASRLPSPGVEPVLPVTADITIAT